MKVHAVILTVLLLCAASAYAQGHRPARQQDPARYDKELRGAAARWSIDLDLLKGMIQQESRFDTAARSHTGAIGLGQFTDIGRAEVRRLARLNPYKKVLVKDPQLHAALKSFNRRGAAAGRLAIEASALYLHHLLRTYEPNVEAALTHYNAGRRMARHVQRHGYEEARRRGLLTFSDAHDYARKVLDWKKKFTAGWKPGARVRSGGLSGAVGGS